MARAKALFLVLLACGAALLLASPAAAAKPCWQQVLDDWSQDGSVDGSYSARCIDEALEKVPEDIRAYGNFEEQAKAARIAAGRRLQGSGVNDPDASSAETQRMREREPNAKDETPVGWALRTRGKNADSFPLPLLILLGLAGALITAGAAGLGARKLKARRTAG